MSGYFSYKQMPECSGATGSQNPGFPALICRKNLGRSHISGKGTDADSQHLIFVHGLKQF